jgi:hypothetical protein
MNWGDGVGIVTLCLAIYLLTKWEKGHQDHLLRRVEKADQTKTMIAR